MKWLGYKGICCQHLKLGAHVCDSSTWERSPKYPTEVVELPWVQDQPGQKETPPQINNRSSSNNSTYK